MSPKLEQNLRDSLPVPLTDEEVHEILTTFLDEFQSCCDELRALRDDGTDFTSIRRITHTIKGFAANVGAHDLYDLGIALNQAAHAADTPACQRLIGDILHLNDTYHAETSP